MWDLKFPGPGIKLIFPALKCGVLTTDYQRSPKVSNHDKVYLKMIILDLQKSSKIIEFSYTLHTVSPHVKRTMVHMSELKS